MVGEKTEYGLEACPLRKSDCSSLDFVVNRFFMKLFKTNNIDVVNYLLRLRHIVENLQISIGCVTMLFVSHLYFVNMCQ